jgi:hypothetical protein
MRRSGFLRALLAAAALAVAPAWSLALEEQSLLTPDGTLHVLRAGRAVDLGIDGVPPESILIEHATRALDGSTTLAILPGSESYQDKRGLQLGYDEDTRTLLLLWTEDISAFSHIRLGVLRDGVWTNSPLLPSEGISRAHNPQMQITHQRVTHLDESDVTVARTSSIVSVIWWEEASALQARLGILFLDAAAFDPASLSVYDLPVLTGGTGASAYDDVPSGAYLYPSLQTDGLSGALLVSYADLNADRHRVLQVRFPDFQGKPSEEGNLDWKRRHIPIVGIAAEGPMARMTPRRAPGQKRELGVGTSIGGGYRPTLYWLEESSLKYTRLGAADWEPVRSIAIDETMTYEKALDLVVGMGSRN